ncbi:MAG: PGF-pre-PGF domain-containing protein, partial [SAR202 cluster bacterium]
MLENIGKYEIREKIGEGGQASVYIGHDTVLDSRVAIKIINPNSQNNDQTVKTQQYENLKTQVLGFTQSSNNALDEELKNEASTARNLTHPNITTIYDFVIQDNYACIVMEYIPNSLDKEISQTTKLDPVVSTKIIIQVCKALFHAHENGFIHKDIKPQNILLTDEGIPKVTDFGISNTQDTGIGTPSYMSPEQIQGNIQPDSRSDIYALGITLYEMLTGEKPFLGNKDELFIQHIDKNISDASKFAEIPDNLQKIIKKCVAKDPNDRYQSTLEIVSELENGEEKPAKKSSKKYLNYITAIGAIILLGTTITVSLTRDNITGLAFGINDETQSVQNSLVEVPESDLKEIPNQLNLSTNDTIKSQMIPFQLKGNSLVALPKIDNSFAKASKISINSNGNPVSDQSLITLTDLETSEVPALPTSSIFIKSMDISLETTIDSSSIPGIIEFYISREWLDSQNISESEIFLYRFNIKWEKLNTKYINDIVDQEKFFAVFAADTPGFSIFSIGIEKNQEIKIENKINTPTPETINPSEIEPTSASTPNIIDSSTPTPTQVENIPYAIPTQVPTQTPPTPTPSPSPTPSPTSTPTPTPAPIVKPCRDDNDNQKVVLDYEHRGIIDCIKDKDVWILDVEDSLFNKTVSISVISNSSDMYLELTTPSNSVMEDDDGGTGSNPLLPFIPLNQKGKYEIKITPLDNNVGRYTLIVKELSSTIVTPTPSPTATPTPIVTPTPSPTATPTPIVTPTPTATSSVMTLLGHYDFENDDVGTQWHNKVFGPSISMGDVQYVSDSVSGATTHLYSDGDYEHKAKVNIPNINYSHFSVSADFLLDPNKTANQAYTPIVVGGQGWRWFSIFVNENNYLG